MKVPEGNPPLLAMSPIVTDDDVPARPDGPMKASTSVMRVAVPDEKGTAID